MSTSHDHHKLRDLSCRIFEAAGVPSPDARTVSDMLIDAELMGLSSHGLQRIPQYVDEIRQGVAKPGADVIAERRSPTTASVDGQWSLGQVVAKRATEEAIDMAKESGTGSAVVRGCRHVGRLGGYTELCAANDCIGLATASCGNNGQWVAHSGAAKAV
jgi:LDH2 family malate/lactate/ureidoglycolate dehydrogenase